MSLLQRNVALFYLIVLVINLCSLTFAAPTGGIGVTEVAKDNDSFYHYIMTALLQHVDINYIEGEKKNGRVKRQSGAGKFSDAAKMSPTKVMRLYLQMFKNLFTSDPIGGIHPMSPEAPKPVVKLFKHRIIEFFFPDVGNEKV